MFTASSWQGNWYKGNVKMREMILKKELKSSGQVGGGLW
jgi:hypothetical protein